MKPYQSALIAAAMVLVATGIFAAIYKNTTELVPIVETLQEEAKNTTSNDPNSNDSNMSTNSNTPANTPPKTPAPKPPTINKNTPPATAPPLTTPTPNIGSSEIMAWLYPGKNACSAKAEYSDGRKIDILKPQYFTVGYDGSLNLLTEKEYGCNGYSEKNVSDVKKYSKYQYATIASGDTTGMNIFLETSLSGSDTVNVLVSFVVDNDITGLELDFEDYGNWDKDSYNNYKLFIEKLGQALHAKGKKLMIDGPATANATEEAWYIWRYADFVSLPVDKVVVMTYDHQYDQGPGLPIAPSVWVKQVVAWTLSRFPEKNRLTFGIASYGYKAKVGTQKFTLVTYDDIKNEPGFSTAKRDTSSDELTWQNGDMVFVYNDQQSMARQLQTIKDAGINSVSVWHLGGNQWF